MVIDFVIEVLLCSAHSMFENASLTQKTPAEMIPRKILTKMMIPTQWCSVSRDRLCSESHTVDFDHGNDESDHKHELTARTVFVHEKNTEMSTHVFFVLSFEERSLSFTLRVDHTTYSHTVLKPIRY